MKYEISVAMEGRGGRGKEFVIKCRCRRRLADWQRAVDSFFEKRHWQAARKWAIIKETGNAR